MIDFVGAVRADSARFHDLISRIDMEAPVPSCPGWSVFDLAWHLANVQHRWSIIVADLLDDPATVPKLPEAAPIDLPDVFEEVSGRLVEALEQRDPDDRCWSWLDNPTTVGWVRRRQAHETLIHRVDAELATGGPFGVDPLLGADGVDEILRVYLDAGRLDAGTAAFRSGDVAAVLSISDGSASWAVELGHMTTDVPGSRIRGGQPALQLIDHTDEPAAVISGRGNDMDLWLWGRGPSDPLTIEGDPAIAARIRATAASGT